MRPLAQAGGCVRAGYVTVRRCVGALRPGRATSVVSQPFACMLPVRYEIRHNNHLVD